MGKLHFSHKRSFFVFTFFIGLLCANPAYADVPIVPVMTLMNIPFIASIASAGTLFLLVVLVELPIIWKCAALSFFDSLKLSLWANLYSTFIGLLIAFAYSSGIGALIGAAIGARWFTDMFSDLSERTGKFTWLAKRRKLCMVLFLSGGIGVAFLGINMMPWHGLTMRTTLPVKALEPKSVFTGTMLLLASGFLLTCISEGYILARKAPEKQDKIIKTTLFMNVVSYTILLFFCIYFFLAYASSF